MKIVKFVTAAAFTALAFGAQAQTKGDRIDQRQDKQQQRIDAGVKSGQLNKQEAARLNKQQERIRKMEDKARADGKVTAKERARIEKAQDRASKNIQRDRKDKQRAKK